ncbi:MAG: AmmeMemoRadiSam system protein A [Candidatus Aminicenantales bacterium]
MSELLDSHQQKYLLRLVRQVLENKLKKGTVPKVKCEDTMLMEKRGAFVTLKFRGQLRGCIGHPLPYKPLIESIMEVAISAATQDFRFEPLSFEELKDTRIEISVLTQPRPITDVNEIQIGKHGIIVSKGFQKGLLLPQVPIEYNWNLETFLRHGCLKAGLNEDEWKKKAQIEVFEAQVFSE